MKRRSKIRGLSLLEILVSMVILSLILVGMANVFVTGKQYILHSRSRMTATELAKFFMDPMQQWVREDKYTSTDADNQLFKSNATPPVIKMDNLEYLANYSTGEVFSTNGELTTLRMVNMTVTWHEK